MRVQCVLETFVDEYAGVGAVRDDVAKNLGIAPRANLNLRKVVPTDAIVLNVTEAAIVHIDADLQWFAVKDAEYKSREKYLKASVDVIVLDERITLVTDPDGCKLVAIDIVAANGGCRLFMLNVQIDE